MTDNTENLTLQILRELRNDITTLHTEMRDGFNRVDVRLGAVEQSLASMLGVSASDRDELRHLKERIERIERRLELQD